MLYRIYKHEINWTKDKKGNVSSSYEIHENIEASVDIYNK